MRGALEAPHALIRAWRHTEARGLPPELPHRSRQPPRSGRSALSPPKSQVLERCIGGHALKAIVVRMGLEIHEAGLPRVGSRRRWGCLLLSSPDLVEPLPKLLLPGGSACKPTHYT